MSESPSNKSPHCLDRVLENIKSICVARPHKPLPVTVAHLLNDMYPVSELPLLLELFAELGRRNPQFGQKANELNATLRPNRKEANENATEAEKAEDDLIRALEATIYPTNHLIEEAIAAIVELAKEDPAIERALASPPHVNALVHHP